METKNPALPAFKYPYQFEPLTRDLQKENEKYFVFVVDWKSNYQGKVDHLEAQKEYLNTSNADRLRWSAWERDKEQLALAITRQQKIEKEILHSIKYYSETIAGLWSEIIVDYTYKILAEEQFQVYLRKLHLITQTGHDLPAYNTPKWQEIKKAIADTLKYDHLNHA